MNDELKKERRRGDDFFSFFLSSFSALSVSLLCELVNLSSAIFFPRYFFEVPLAHFLAF